VEVGTPVNAAASFTIPNTADLGMVMWDWGDAPPLNCPADPACTVYPGVGRVTGSHTYDEPGVYTVLLRVADVFGQFDASIYEFVVVYDPNSGFVTGGGWIDSPAGAYQPDPSLTGKANFGFASRYKKGAIRPIGYTRFQFHVADLKFHSDSYQWLVVNREGTRAQFKGDGTINGAPSLTGDNYRFKLWATDGDALGVVDTFRIKIWDEDDNGVETIVYDNGFDQPIGAGSITVHTGKGKK
jgi:PKD repeat protein